MPSARVHLSQAQHNEKLGETLKQSLLYKDWLITTAFYAAVHYVEYELAKNVPPMHTEKNSDGDWHAWRSQQVALRLNLADYVAYTNLRHNSTLARYLCVSLERPEDTQGKIAQDYFGDQDAKDLIDIDLRKIRETINSRHPFS